MDHELATDLAALAAELGLDVDRDRAALLVAHEALGVYAEGWDADAIQSYAVSWDRAAAQARLAAQRKVA